MKNRTDDAIGTRPLSEPAPNTPAMTWGYAEVSCQAGRLPPLIWCFRPCQPALTLGSMQYRQDAMMRHDILVSDPDRKTAVGVLRPVSL